MATYEKILKMTPKLFWIQVKKANDFIIDQVMKLTLKNSTEKILPEKSVDFFFALFADNLGICWYSFQQRWHEVRETLKVSTYISKGMKNDSNLEKSPQFKSLFHLWKLHKSIKKKLRLLKKYHHLLLGRLVIWKSKIKNLRII